MRRIGLAIVLALSLLVSLAQEAETVTRALPRSPSEIGCPQSLLGRADQIIE